MIKLLKSFPHLILQGRNLKNFLKSEMYCIINTNELINHSQFQFQRVLLTKIFKEQALKFPYQQIYFLKFAYYLKEIKHKNSTYLICPGPHEFPWQTCKNLHVFIAFAAQFLKTVNICQKQDATKDTTAGKSSTTTVTKFDCKLYRTDTTDR